MKGTMRDWARPYEEMQRLQTAFVYTPQVIVQGARFSAVGRAWRTARDDRRD